MKQKEIKKQIEKALKENFQLEKDGHGIYLPEYYYQIGFPPEFVDKFVKEHYSDGTIKGTIHSDGKTKQVAIGVYNLDILQALAELFELKTPFFFGRGRMADAIIDALKTHLGVH